MVTRIDLNVGERGYVRLPNTISLLMNYLLYRFIRQLLWRALAESHHCKFTMQSLAHLQ